MRVEAASPDDFGWLVQRVGCDLTPRATGIRAVDACGLIRGMIVYDLWTDGSVQAHMAVDTPIVWRSLLGPAFRYPFEECKRGVLLAVVRGDNEKSARLCSHFGFEPVAVIQDGAANGVPLVTFQMRKETCRFLKAA